MTTPTQTLHEALAAATARGLNYKIQGHTPGDLADPQTLTVRTGPLSKPASVAPHPLNSVIRAVLKAHAVDGQGTSGGALEHYPLDDGRVFSVTWIGGEGGTPQSAILNIAPMQNAW